MEQCIDSYDELRMPKILVFAVNNLETQEYQCGVQVQIQIVENQEKQLFKI